MLYRYQLTYLIKLWSCSNVTTASLSKVYVVSNIIIIVCEINVFNSCTKCTYDSSNRRKNQSNVNKSGRLMMFCFTRGYTVMLLNQLTRTPAMFFSINAPYDEFITSPSLEWKLFSFSLYLQIMSNYLFGHKGEKLILRSETI